MFLQLFSFFLFFLQKKHIHKCTIRKTEHGKHIYINTFSLFTKNTQHLIYISFNSDTYTLSSLDTKESFLQCSLFFFFLFSFMACQKRQRTNLINTSHLSQGKPYNTGRKSAYKWPRYIHYSFVLALIKRTSNKFVENYTR